jgi:hypothetical protein
MKDLATCKGFCSLVIGCGYSSQRALCKCDYVVCLDIDKEKLRIAKKRDPCAHYVVGDAQLLPFRSKCVYDAVCTDVLEHILCYEQVVVNIAKLSPKVIYLRFPTETREKLLIKVSRTYREEHLHKVHVVIVRPKKVIELLKRNGYEVNLDLTLGSSTLTRIILHSFFEKLGIKYRIPEIGLIKFEKECISYEAFAYVCSFLGLLISLPLFLLWKFFHIKTIHDGWIILAQRIQ